MGRGREGRGGGGDRRNEPGGKNPESKESNKVVIK